MWSGYERPCALERASEITATVDHYTGVYNTPRTSSACTVWETSGDVFRTREYTADEERAHLRYTRAQSRDVQRVYLFENQFLRGDRSIAIHEALVESRLVAAFYE
jgi:hypothetical protein